MDREVIKAIDLTVDMIINSLMDLEQIAWELKQVHPKIARVINPADFVDAVYGFVDGDVDYMVDLLDNSKLKSGVEKWIKMNGYEL